MYILFSQLPSAIAYDATEASKISTIDWITVSSVGCFLH